LKRIKEALEVCLKVKDLKNQRHIELVGVQFVEVQVLNEFEASTASKVIKKLSNFRGSDVFWFAMLSRYKSLAPKEPQKPLL